jgi:hypothetical protein
VVTGRTIEKISVVVVVAVLGVALAVNVRGAPVALLIAGLVVTVCAGMDLVLRGEARYRPTPDLFILPAALVTGTVLFVSLLSSGTSIVAGLTVFGALLFAVFWAEFSRLGVGIRPELPPESETGEGANRAAESHSTVLGIAGRHRAELVLAVAGYMAAFALYASIYQFRTRSLLSAPAIIAVTFLLAARQLRLAHEPRPQSPSPADGTSATVTSSLPAVPPPWPKTLMYSAVIALAAGEVTWALNYWPLNALLGGAFVLATFYLLVGIFSHQLQNRLTGWLVVEYGTVSAVCAIAIAVVGLVRRGF